MLSWEYLTGSGIKPPHQPPSKHAEPEREENVDLTSQNAAVEWADDEQLHELGDGLGILFEPAKGMDEV